MHLRSIWVHGLANEEFVVFEVGNNLLCVSCGTLLERSNLLITGAVGLELFLDGLHVALQVGQVALLVETRLIEAERVDDIDLGLGGILSALLITTLGGGVGASVDLDWADSDLLAVGLVDDAVNLLEIVRVRDQLVASDNVLCG